MLSQPPWYHKCVSKPASDLLHIYWILSPSRTRPPATQSSWAYSLPLINISLKRHVLSNFSSIQTVEHHASSGCGRYVVPVVCSGLLFIDRYNAKVSCITHLWIVISVPIYLQRILNLLLIRYSYFDIQSNYYSFFQGKHCIVSYASQMFQVSEGC